MRATQESPPGSGSERRSNLNPPIRPVASKLFFAIRDGLISLHSQTGVGEYGVPSGNAILVFHGVGDTTDVGYSTVSTARFRSVIELVSAERRAVPLAEVTGETADRRVAITFDDGLRSTYEHALPILREFEVPATVFVNPDLVGDRNRDVLAARHEVDHADRITMTEAEIRELVECPLITIGNHTRTHPDLSSLEDEADLRAEIVGGKAALEDTYGISADAFAYPYGRHHETAREIVEATHDVSVGTSPRLVGDGSDPHLLPRIPVTDSLAELRWELSPASDWLHALNAFYKKWVPGQRPTQRPVSPQRGDSRRVGAEGADRTG